MGQGCLDGPGVLPFTLSGQRAPDRLHAWIELEIGRGLGGQGQDGWTLDRDGSGRGEIERRLIGHLLFQGDRGGGGGHDARAWP